MAVWDDTWWYHHELDLKAFAVQNRLPLSRVQYDQDVCDPWVPKRITNGWIQRLSPSTNRSTEGRWPTTFLHQLKMGTVVNFYSCSAGYNKRKQWQREVLIPFVCLVALGLQKSCLFQIPKGSLPHTQIVELHRGIWCQSTPGGQIVSCERVEEKRATVTLRILNWKEASG